jgi:hypothetical protein
MSDPTATKGAQQFGDLFGAYLSRATAGDDDPLPAKVLAYDRVKQTADCQVLVKVPSDNELTDPPPVHGAQVLWLSGGTWSIVGDLVPGDPGWLVPPGADTSRWARFGTERSTEVTPDAKSLGDAFFIPGSRPASAPLPTAAYKAAALVLRGTLYLGDSTATDFVALASLVLTELQSIVDQFNLHTHPTPAGASNTPSVAMTDPNDVAAEKVKAK